MSMATRSSDLDDQKSIVNIQTEGHTFTPPSGQNGPEDPEAFGNAPSHSPSQSLARKPTPDWPKTWYCLEIQVILTKDGGTPPPPPHAWHVPVVEEMVWDGKSGLTEAAVTGPSQAILFYGWWLLEGLSLGKVQDAAFMLLGAIGWVGKQPQLNTNLVSLGEGWQLTTQTITEGCITPRRPGCPCSIHLHQHHSTSIIRTSLYRQKGSKLLLNNGRYLGMTLGPATRTWAKHQTKTEAKAGKNCGQLHHITFALARSWIWKWLKFSINFLISVIKVWQVWGSRHSHCSQWHWRESEGHMKINLPVFKDEYTRCHHLSELTLNLTVYCCTECQDCTLLPYAIHSLQGYLEELVRSSGMDITLDDVLTILDEHYNNVKALDAMKQKLFQLQMGEKESVLDWGVHLLRHLQVLPVSFLEQFPPDHVAELKHDHFYGGLPKWLKAMVAYLKASTTEKTYSDYLWEVREAEKEVMEPPHSQMADSKGKPKVMSFFPLWKLKGTQPARTPAVWVAHLEEESTDKEEGPESEDPDGIEGITKEFTVCLTRAVKDAQQEKKHCYHCSSPEHYIHDCPLVKVSWMDLQFKPKGADGAKEGSPGPSRKSNHPKGAPRGDAKGIGHHAQTPFLNPDPFHRWYGIKNVARVRVNGESCMALLDNGAQINTIMPGFVKNCSLDVGSLSDLVGRWVTCVGLGKTLLWPMCYVVMCSSGWSQSRATTKIK